MVFSVSSTLILAGLASGSTRVYASTRTDITRTGDSTSTRVVTAPRRFSSHCFHAMACNPCSALHQPPALGESCEDHSTGALPVPRRQKGNLLLKTSAFYCDSMLKRTNRHREAWQFSVYLQLMDRRHAPFRRGVLRASICRMLCVALRVLSMRTEHRLLSKMPRFAPCMNRWKEAGQAMHPVVLSIVGI